MRTVFKSFALFICIGAFLSCSNEPSEKKQAIYKIDFKPVSPDTSYLFKDSAFRPDDYHQNKYDYGYNISLIRLITTPELYHNKRVYVSGFLHLDFEESGLYLHEEDAKHALGKNGIYIDFGDSTNLTPIIQNFNNRYITIRGVFDMHSTGHMGFNSGGIKDISRMNRIK